MGGSAAAERIGTFVAIGDSFTEGLNDRLPGGGFRGWADRFADLLAAGQPGLRLTGRSSGDNVPPKRPELQPLDALTGFHGPEASGSA